MLKEMGKTTEKRTPSDVLLQIRWDDFRQEEDGSWVTTREIVIDGPGGTDRLIKADRGFKRGEMSVFGIDLAALLEKHLGRPSDPVPRKLWNFKS
jgi:hypothetical protein